MAKVTFEDKEDVRSSTLPVKNKLTAENVTELKNSINDLYDQSINISGSPNKGDRVEYDGSEWVSVPLAAAATTTEVIFSSPLIWDDDYTPKSGNITADLTDARLGIVQKIYHEDGSAPSFPAGWVLLGSGTYDTAALNIIYAEWVGGTRVEYWIVQEQ